MNGRTVLITGVNGFIGSHLRRVLQESFPGARVLGLDLTGAGKPQVFVADLLNRDDLFALIGETRPDFIFHLAGTIYSKDWNEQYRGNVETTVNLLEAVKGSGLSSRVIVPGSAAEYGRVSMSDLPLTERQQLNPVSHYGVAKVWQTTVTRYYALHGSDAVIGRMFNIIGQGAPEGLSIGAFASQLSSIKKNEQPARLTVGNLRPRRDFIDVRDACLGLIAIARSGRSGEAYNICSGGSVSMGEVLNLMIRQSCLDVDVTVDPERLKHADIDDIFGSYEKIRSETGWKPSSTLEQSVAEVVNGF